MNEAVNIFEEFAKYPITTVISIIAVVMAMYWFFVERPKDKKARIDAANKVSETQERIAKEAHEDRVKLAEEHAASREIIKLNQSVINNNTAAIQAQTASNQSLKLLTERQVERIDDMRECVHEEHCKMCDKLDEIVASCDKSITILENTKK